MILRHSSTVSPRVTSFAALAMASSAPDSALASEAMEAFVDDDFASAFELYTKLVDAAPTRASAWIHRSATLLKLQNEKHARELG